MTGGQALVAALTRQGIETIFALPGVQLDWAFDALYDSQDTIRIVHTRHEQATSYMADGYARTTGRVGVCLVVPGPGLLNASAGLATAYSCNSPVLCIAGQIQSDLIERGRGMLHEIPHQLEMVRSVTKWAGRAMAPGEVPGLVAEAFRQLGTGRTRPVEIEIPPDVLQAQADVAPADVVGAPQRPNGDPDLLEAAAKALGEAKSPIIFVGGGVISAGASESLRELAELLQAPVVMTSNGKGALSSRHYLAQNTVGGRTLLPESDVVLVAGTRFVPGMNQNWGLRPDQTVIQLDIDPEEVGRNVPVAIGIVGDVKQGLGELAERVPRHNRKRDSRQEELAGLKERIDDLLFEVQPQASFAQVLREELPEDGILVNESTQVGYWSNLGFPVYQPRTFLTSGFQGTLGYGFATALGAQVGNPDKHVVSVNGDGGFMYNVQELSTAVRHNIPLTTVVFNDNAYGNVRRIQKQSFNGRTIASDLLNPDFVKLAESFGMEGIRAGGPEELRTALQRAMKNGHPALIEVPVGEMPNMYHITRGGAVRR
ncbi:MAG TPA: thiamine pyrophosphate-dependent enzyme [Thermomicrobiaceae bacterium]|nr:thiamine pyrophosphate-dependent enzyme [Thermomicrobiaceae bacterium]